MTEIDIANIHNQAGLPSGMFMSHDDWNNMSNVEYDIIRMNYDVVFDGDVADVECTRKR